MSATQHEHEVRPRGHAPALLHRGVGHGERSNAVQVLGALAVQRDLGQAVQAPAQRRGFSSAVRRSITPRPPAASRAAALWPARCARWPPGLVGQRRIGLQLVFRMRRSVASRVIILRQRHVSNFE
jgi:hypothetical protein